MNAASAGVSWIVMIAMGAGFLWGMTRTKLPLADAILVRFAAASFVGSGVIGATGVLGDWANAAIGWLTSFIDGLTVEYLGSAVVWIVVMGIGCLWVCAMIPDKWFKYDAPDWLLFSGPVLPALLVAVPGRLGDGLTTVITAVGEGMVSLIAFWI